MSDESETISVGSCPECGHFPTQFLQAGDEVYHYHLVLNGCTTKGMHERLEVMERDYNAMYIMVKAYEDKYGPNA